MEQKARLTFLGTGTSSGIPMIGCDCAVCRSADPRDKRLRAAALVEYGGLTILVDAGPDFNLCERHPVNIYCQPYVEDTLRREYAYAFAEQKYPGAPEWHLHRIDGAHPFLVHSNAGEEVLSWERGFGYHHLPPQSDTDATAEVIPIQGWHHREKKLSVLGYRFGNIAYLTDIKMLDSEAEFDKLKGVEYVTLGCVKVGDHHSHPSLPEALDFFARVGARESYITHMSHQLPCHEAFAAMLPPHVHPAWDGLVIG